MPMHHMSKEEGLLAREFAVVLLRSAMRTLRRQQLWERTLDAAPSPATLSTYRTVYRYTALQSISNPDCQ